MRRLLIVRPKLTRKGSCPVMGRASLAVIRSTNRSAPWARKARSIKVLEVITRVATINLPVVHPAAHLGSHPTPTVAATGLTPKDNPVATQTRAGSRTPLGKQTQRTATHDRSHATRTRARHDGTRRRTNATTCATIRATTRARTSTNISSTIATTSPKPHHSPWIPHSASARCCCAPTKAAR